MTRELISKRTRNEFRETLVSWTLREIEIEFDNEGFTPDLSYNPPLTGQRRSYVEQFYKNIDFASAHHVERLLRVYEAIIIKVRLFDQNRAQGLVSFLERDGFRYSESRFSLASGTGAIRRVREIAAQLTAQELLNQVHRIESAVENDPALAIGTAKELVESCCKTILVDRGVSPDRGADLPVLMRLTLKELELLPDDVPDSSKGVDAIRKTLRSLSAVVDGMAEIRNLYGTGHGKHGHSRGLSARHGRLAVGAASTLAMFLFETHSARVPNVGSSPKAGSASVPHLGKTAASS